MSSADDYQSEYSTLCVMYYKPILVLLGVSAAFNMVDHKIRLNRLEKRVGISGAVRNWFESYLQNRDCFVSIGNYKFERTKTWGSSRVHSQTPSI